jgi:hypothetical protein
MRVRTRFLRISPILRTWTTGTVAYAARGRFILRASDRRDVLSGGRGDVGLLNRGSEHPRRGLESSNCG